MRLGLLACVVLVSIAIVSPVSSAGWDEGIRTWYLVPPASAESGWDAPPTHHELDPQTRWVETTGEGSFVNVVPVPTALVVSKSDSFRVFLDEREALLPGTVTTTIRLSVLPLGPGTPVVIATGAFSSTQDASVPGSHEWGPGWTTFELDVLTGTGLPESATSVTVPAGRALLLEVWSSTDSALGSAAGARDDLSGDYDAAAGDVNGLVDATGGVVADQFAQSCDAHPRCEQLEGFVGGLAESTAATTAAMLQGVGNLLASGPLPPVPIGQFRLATPDHPSRLDIRLA